MSIFTSLVTQMVPIPHDEGQSVTIRKLAPKQLNAAAMAAQIKSVEQLAQMQKAGAADLLQAVQQVTPEAAQQAAAVDPVLLYDPIALITSGVVASTYDCDLRSVEIAEDLDEETQLLLARAILKLSRPQLFADAEEARKNG